MSLESRTFTIGLVTGMVLTAAVAYAISPYVANKATQRGVRRLLSEFPLPESLTTQFAQRAGVLVASEVQRSLYS